MTQAQYIKKVKREWMRKKSDDSPIETAIRLVRLEAWAYEGCGHGYESLMALADKLEDYL
jgi:hypothetical protein